MNKEVNFEIAKLLQEKGFDEPCSHAYKEVESPVLYIHRDKKYNNSFKKEWQDSVRKNSHMDNAVIKRYSAPTISEVVMWLYEKHGIWIVVQLDLVGRWYYDTYTIQDNIPNHNTTKKVERFNSPTEAYEAAIKYVLEKLI